MNVKTLTTAIALAALAFLTACGGGDGSADSVAMPSQQAAGVGGIGGSGALPAGVGGIGGSGALPAGVGGIGGSGALPAGVGGIGGSGARPASVAQACSLQSVDVTIAGARVNADGAADLGSAGWIDVPLTAPARVNLLALASGASLPLNLGALPDGSYGQIRLLLAANDAGSPLADSVVANSIETALAVPWTAQGGLPLALHIDVTGGQASASWQGLDVCSAVAANSGTFALDAVAGGATRVASIN
jgi:hypothetical protein